MTADWQAMVDALAAIDIDATSMLAVLRHGWDLLATGKSCSHVDVSALHQQLLDGGFDCAVPGSESKWSVRNVSAETLRRSLSADWVRKVMGDERREFAALRIDFCHRNAEVSFHVVPGLAKVLLTQPDLLLATMVDGKGDCVLPEAAALDPTIPKPRPPKRPALLGEREYWVENIERESITID